VSPLNIFEEATEIPHDHFIQGGEYLNGNPPPGQKAGNIEDKKEATAKFSLEEDEE